MTHAAHTAVRAAVLAAARAAILAAGLALAVQAVAAPAPASTPAPGGAPPTAAEPLRGVWHRPSGKRVSLASSLTVNAALERIADAAGWSLVLDTGPGGEKALTLRLKDVPAEDAFRAVVAEAGLVAERRGDLVTVRAEGMLPGILPPAIGREAQRATEDALRAARRAMEDARRGDDDPDASAAGPDRHAAGASVEIAAGERVRDAVAWRGDVRVGAGAVARNVVAFGGTVSLAPDAAVHDAVAFGGRTTVGPGARVLHDAVAFGGDLTLGPSAEVGHDAVAIGGQVVADPAARVHGSIHSIPFPGLPRLWIRGALVPGLPSPVTLLLQALTTFAVLFVLGLGVMVLFPRRLDAVSGALAGGPFRSLFAGLFGSLGMALLAVLLVLTVVGILLVPVQILAIVAGGVLGLVAFACSLGRLLPFPRSRRTLVLELAAGTLLFAVLTQVPVLGGLVWFVTWLVGFGAVLRTRFGAPPAILPTTPAA